MPSLDNESRPRILVVEDDQNLNAFLAKVVQRSGCTPVSAYTGEDALSILRNHGAPIDWLLTDIKLPGAIDGWVVGSEFALTHPTRPVIYMSSVEEDSASRRSSNSIFLTKPVDANDLVTTFRRLGCVGL